MSKVRSEAPWDALLDGRFDSSQPGRTLWRLFADQRGRVVWAVTLFVIKQSPASLMPFAVGMIVDALTPLKDGSFSRVLWIAGIYLLLLAQNPLLHTGFSRLMSGMLRRMQFNLRSALVERLQQLAVTFHEESRRARSRPKSCAMWMRLTASAGIYS